VVTKETEDGLAKRPTTCEKGVPKHGSFRNHIKNLGMLLYFSEESKESK
jgi:hypothetical protein